MESSEKGFQLKKKCTGLSPYFPTFLLSYFPTFLHSYFPTFQLSYFLLSYFHTSLLSYFSISLLPYFPTSLFPYLPTYLLTYLPTYLFTYLPTFLLSYLSIIREMLDAPGIPILKLWPWLLQQQQTIDRVFLHYRSVIGASLWDGLINWNGNFML